MTEIKIINPNTKTILINKPIQLINELFIKNPP